MDSGQSRDEIINQQMVEEYNVDATTAEADVDRILDQSLGFLQTVDKAP